jgi:AcrR family transcriptional regulator
MAIKDQAVRNRRRKQARPQEIIDSALNLWATRGFSDTKIEDIAKGAGIAKGTVYLYFKSKEALFEAAVKERLTPTMEGIAQVAKDSNQHSRDLLTIFYESVYEEFFGHGSVVLIKVLIAEGQRFPTLAETYREAAMSRAMGLIKILLQRGIDRGELDQQAADLDPRLIMAPVMIFIVWGIVFGEYKKEEFNRLVNQHIELIFKGLSTR